MTRTHNAQQGSVFVYILLAIALLGGLTYAVSRGNRTNTNALTAEQAKLAAQEIIEYGNVVAAAVQKLRLRGCADTEISFENSFSSDNYTNPNAPTDESCHVFSPIGAQINFKSTPVAIQEGIYGNYKFMTQTNGGGASARQHGTPTKSDLYLYIRGRYDNNWQTQIRFLKICDEINKILEIKKYSLNENELPTGYRPTALFIGEYDDSAPTINYPELAGLNSYCSNENIGYFNFSQLLIAR